MKALPLPPSAYLRDALQYDPESGKLFWKERPISHFGGAKRSAEECAKAWNSLYAHREAMTALSTDGYRKGRLSGRELLAHRVIWKLVHGLDPDHIDHIDGDRSNNKLANLRSVTPSENNRNRRQPKTNTSGAIGVCWVESEGAWVAYVRVHLGYFDRFEDAVAAREEAARRFAYHPYHGKRGLIPQEEAALAASGGAR
ncbi:MAG TPA: HNH endonuclease [Allosphingosinicella sp.]|nr:HNH endonuclease [Allosphingosinicella sp.]